MSCPCNIDIVLRGKTRVESLFRKRAAGRPGFTKERLDGVTLRSVTTAPLESCCSPAITVDSGREPTVDRRGFEGSECQRTAPRTNTNQGDSHQPPHRSGGGWRRLPERRSKPPAGSDDTSEQGWVRPASRSLKGGPPRSAGVRGG